MGRLTGKLRGGEPVFGLVVQSAMSQVCEVAALLGYDFVWLDMEHTALSWREVEHQIIALENRGCVPLVRVARNDANLIGQAFDFGAGIVDVPHVDTAEEARQAVQAAKYYPLGRRGCANSTRSNGQGQSRLDQALMDEQNASAMLMVQIESQTAVQNAAAIAAVPGVDLLFVGLADLCQDLGVPCDPEQPAVQAALAAVSQAIRQSGKFGALSVADPARLKAFTALGFGLICCGIDTILFRQAAEARLAQFNKEASR
jgi:2-keto-3-deoxy-L-rhamnonate aldolase RhmA